MNTQIFGCPTCNQRFQVSAEQAGQIVACPSCGQTVEIPVAAFPSLVAPVAAPVPAAPLPPSATDQVVACGQCTGQFRVTPDLFGQPITCPHCQQIVVVAAPFTSPSAPATAVSGEEAGSSADIQINLRGSRKRTSPSRNRAPSFSFDEPETSEPAPPISNSPATQPIAQAIPAEATSPSAAAMPPVESKQVESKQVEPKQSAQNEAISSPVNRKRATRRQANPDRSSPTEDTTEFSRPAPQQAPPTSPEIPASPPAAAAETASSPAASAPTSSATSNSSPSSVADPSSAPTINQPEADATPTANVPSTSSSKSDRQSSESKSDARSDLGKIRFTTSLKPEELLPPRFEIEDTTRIRASAADDFKVVLPDAEGGLKQFDQRILHVEYGGEKVSLIATTPEEQQRRRTINNLISIVIGIVILAVAYWLLM